MNEFSCSLKKNQVHIFFLLYFTLFVIQRKYSEVPNNPKTYILLNNMCLWPLLLKKWPCMEASFLPVTQNIYSWGIILSRNLRQCFFNPDLGWKAWTNITVTRYQKKTVYRDYFSNFCLHLLVFIIEHCHGNVWLEGWKMVRQGLNDIGFLPGFLISWVWFSSTNIGCCLTTNTCLIFSLRYNTVR